MFCKQFTVGPDTAAAESTDRCELAIISDRLAVSKPVWWLETRMHFSFADYYNPDNICFGALRVCNDDIVRGGGNFGCAPI
jgi:redox-sensitive bicupin YhaK (pirin superfamily)